MNSDVPGDTPTLYDSIYTKRAGTLCTCPLCAINESVKSPNYYIRSHTKLNPGSGNNQVTSFYLYFPCNNLLPVSCYKSYMHYSLDLHINSYFDYKLFLTIFQPFCLIFFTVFWIIFSYKSSLFFRYLGYTFLNIAGIFI